MKWWELSRNSQEFFLLQRIQDEVHRFCHHFPPPTALQNSFSSQLDGIEGLGPKRKQNLMKHFKSLTKIKEASVDSLLKLGAKGSRRSCAEELNPQDEIASMGGSYQTEKPQ